MTDDQAAAMREAGAKRAERFEREGVQPGAQVRSGVALPSGAARRVSTKDMGAPAQLRAKKVDRDGKTFFQVEGYATTYERGYEMWDWAGPYTEIVTAGAGEKTVGASPDVVFLTNHAGLAMARTVASTLELWSDETGMGDRAFLNPTRQDVKDLVAAIEDGTITEQSFAFMIDRGQWSPDYTEFRIMEFDVDRGDVSAVNYGANPYTSIAARSREILDALDHLPAGAQRAALHSLEQRLSVVVVDTDDDDEGEGGDEVACLSCGALNECDALFCDQCGATMPAPSADPATGNVAAMLAAVDPPQVRATGRTITHIEALLEAHL